MKLRLLICTTLLAAFSLSSRAQLIETSASIGISRDSIMIGDTLTLYVDIVKDMASTIYMPEFTDGRLNERLEIISGPKVDTLIDQFKGRATPIRLSYKITSFDKGLYAIDSFPIFLSNVDPVDTLFTNNKVQLTVGTYDIDTTKHRPMDITEIMGAPYSWAEFKADFMHYIWWIVGGVVLIALIILGILWYRSRRRRIAEQKMPLAPHLAAIDSLETIRAQKLWQSGKAKEYYTAITDTIRIYLEGRYGVGAMEMTTSEILKALKELHQEPRLVNSMRELFELSDLVKFAKMVPSGEDCEVAYFDAFYYIEQTKPIEVEQSEEQTLK